MWLVTVLQARAEAPVAVDATDAWYLSGTGRGSEAAAWYLAHRDDDPTSARNLYLALDELGMIPEQRHPSLLAQVRAWGAAHPEAHDLPTALAAAHALGSLGSEDWASMFPQGGDWCEPALEALAELPEAAEPRYRVLHATLRVATACGVDVSPFEAERDALAMTGDAGAWPRAWVGALDGIDEADVEAIRAALDPPVAERLHWFARYAGEPDEADDDEAPGVGRGAVRELVLGHARSLASDARPSRLWAAAQVLRAAGLRDEEVAVRQRIAELDPGNEANPWLLERPRAQGAPKAATEEPEVDATTVLDPEERLRALVEQGPPRGRDEWETEAYWSARADAAALTGDPDAEIAALRRLPHEYQLERTVDAALATRHRRLAAHVAREAMAATADTPTYAVPLDPEGEASWRAERAEAFDLRARVHEVRRHTSRAAADLEAALALAPATSERLLRLGLLYDELGRIGPAAELLGASLVDLADDHPVRRLALERLDADLAKLPGWTPDRASWLAAMTDRREALVGVEAASIEVEDPRFAELTLTLDGEQRRLFDLPGPIVLDVWATWCGPCMQSLPHLESLARRYEGKVTFVAVSVDEEQAVAERYLARRGGSTFRAAWLGEDGMRQLGVQGIPAMFVFDAEHRLVERLAGYGPGDTSLDRAVEEALARR